MSPQQSFVSVHALSAGHLTLPEKFFVAPLDDADARRTVPSLSFLIQHQASPTSNPTRIVYDLGIRRDISQYAPDIRRHTSTRTPLSGTPDVVASLAGGRLKPEDIDFIILSHVHWDHIGMPSDFQTSLFVIGNGAADLLSGARKLQNGGHSFFEADLLPASRTISLSDPEISFPPQLSDSGREMKSDIFSTSWRSKGVFPSTMDIFGDGSVYVVSAPGHLPGHLNLLCRLENGQYVYLAGDSCHDKRLLTGEKEIATWVEDGRLDTICCIHTDKEAAKKTLELIRATEQGGTELGKVEVVFAHDAVWDKEAREKGRFFPGKL